MSFPIFINAQTFERSEMAVGLDNPWEIVYGPDGYLWISDKSGKVVRVNPETGQNSTVFIADDYYGGHNSEKAPCGKGIGRNTFGLALHPDFLNPENSLIYLIYSYNSGDDETPKTLFKIVALQWNAITQSAIFKEDIQTELANGYDHFGGRMISTTENGNDYLYYSTGDTGAHVEGCYETPEDNPNLTTQDPYTKVGKIHRINIDGSIPDDNPIPGNTFFTRGHRNPQGLVFNPGKGIVYDIEHGHATDDEINVLEKGMNYGWINVHGYHDGNFDGELEFVENYVPHPDIENDQLREPLFAWGSDVSSSDNYLDWFTVAPSDGIYYGSNTIEQWTNSLLVVTLKNGSSTNQEVFQFKLNEDGTSLAPSTSENPNPKTFFGEDEDLNGRLRDIALSPDGRKIFLITNNGGKDPIIVYEAQSPSDVNDIDQSPEFSIINYPNPFSKGTTFYIECEKSGFLNLEISDIYGKKITTIINEKVSVGSFRYTWEGFDSIGLQVSSGIYLYTLRIGDTQQSGKIMYIK